MSPPSYDAATEGQALAAGEIPPALVGIDYLARAFIERRLANSGVMESTKQRALGLLAAKLQMPEAEEMSIGRLMEVIDIISKHTGSDLKAVLDATANGRGPPTAGAVNIFFGQGADSNNSERAATASKETYRLLDALDSAALSIVNGTFTEVPPHVHD